ncbi:MAG: Iron-containing alcohol dehydrogenase [Promethearchaeota archaeon]|nr:MAG: Iron-containing alcohol dehydrogenase [Candidatus Lokiarchaeota archaeon]
MISSFNFASIPHIIFGAGKLSQLYETIPKFGKNILILTGEKSLKDSGKWDLIADELTKRNITFHRETVSGEPSPSIVDQITDKYRGEEIELVIGIGGGSVTDAGKAVSAMIPKNDSVINYLEGVGSKKPDGEKIPYIAVPTTSGTGSEATKNAVISQVGPEGFKKSLRHDNYVPNYAFIDPELVLSCPSSVTAASGMDAFSQLLEAYTSTKASPMTDALSFSGMSYMRENIIAACKGGSSDINVRTGMAYGSLMSGMALANAGLGVIHGMAGPIGGLFEIPHGVVCGTLLAEATKMNLEELKKKNSKEAKAHLKKHADIGALLANQRYDQESEVNKYCDMLIDKLEKWTRVLEIKRLSAYGITENDFDKIIEKSGLKNNPVYLSDKEMKKILKNRL